MSKNVMAHLELNDLRYYVYDDKEEAQFSGQLYTSNYVFSGYERANNQIDRFLTDFNRDLRTVMGRNRDLRPVLQAWQKKLDTLTGKLKSFEKERIPQFSPRSKYIADVGLQRFLLEGIPQSISHQAESKVEDAIQIALDIIIKQLPKDFTFKFPTFEDLLAEINVQATTGLPQWQSQSLTDKDGNRTTFSYDLESTYNLIKYMLNNDPFKLFEAANVVPGSRSQAKEPNIPGVRAIFITDFMTKIISMLLELMISPVKKLIYQFAYRSPESEYKEYIKMLDYAKLKRALLASIDLSRWDTTVSHRMINAAYRLIILLIKHFTPDKSLVLLAEAAAYRMVNARMWIKLSSEGGIYFYKERGVISGHGNTSSVGSIVHWLQDIICDLIYFDKYKRNLLSYEYTQYMADDARTVLFRPLRILADYYRKHFHMFLRQDSMVDRSVVEFKQRLYLPNQKIGIVSITRLLNSLMRLERVIRGKPTKVDWAVRNIQIGNDAAGHPLRNWFWRFIKTNDKYINVGIGKKSNVFERFHELPENQEFVTWLLNQ